jgi:hypothetical protein
MILRQRLLPKRRLRLVDVARPRTFCRERLLMILLIVRGRDPAYLRCTISHSLRSKPLGLRGDTGYEVC